LPGAKALETEIDEDRLRNQGDSEAVEHPLADLAGQLHDLSGRPPPAVHDGEGMVRRDPDVSVAMTSCQAGAFDEPGGRELDLAPRRRKAGHLLGETGLPPSADELSHLRGLGGGDDRVDEEGPDAGAVRIEGGDDHGLAPPDLEHGRAYVLE